MKKNNSRKRTRTKNKRYSRKRVSRVSRKRVSRVSRKRVTRKRVTRVTRKRRMKGGMEAPPPVGEGMGGTPIQPSGMYTTPKTIRAGRQMAATHEKRAVTSPERRSTTPDMSRGGRSKTPDMSRGGRSKTPDMSRHPVQSVLPPVQSALPPEQVMGGAAGMVMPPVQSALPKIKLTEGNMRILQFDKLLVTERELDEKFQMLTSQTSWEAPRPQDQDTGALPPIRMTTVWADEGRADGRLDARGFGLINRAYQEEKSSFHKLGPREQVPWGARKDAGGPDPLANLRAQAELDKTLLRRRKAMVTPLKDMTLSQRTELYEERKKVYEAMVNKMPLPTQNLIERADFERMEQIRDLLNRPNYEEGLEGEEEVFYAFMVDETFHDNGYPLIVFETFFQNKYSAKQFKMKRGRDYSILYVPINHANRMDRATIMIRGKYMGERIGADSVGIGNEVLAFTRKINVNSPYRSTNEVKIEGEEITATSPAILKST